jgi:hypothetical protein
MAPTPPRIHPAVFLKKEPNHARISKKHLLLLQQLKKQRLLLLSKEMEI